MECPVTILPVGAVDGVGQEVYDQAYGREDEQREIGDGSVAQDQGAQHHYGAHRQPGPGHDQETRHEDGTHMTM